MEQLPEGKIPALRVMPMPADANQNGDIFGGWIMSQVDIAGGTVAHRLARGRVAHRRRRLRCWSSAEREMTAMSCARSQSGDPLAMPAMACWALIIASCGWFIRL